MRWRTISVRILCCAVLAVSCAVAPGAARQRPEKSVPRKYELAGTLLNGDKKPFRNVIPVVFLHGATSPFTARTLIDPAGHFKFKNLEPALYTLTAAVPRAGEMRQTVEVSPAQADRRGRVAVTIVWDVSAAERDLARVSASQLSIPGRALQEYASAEERLGRRDVAGAEASLLKAVRLAPQFSVAWNQLGVICYQTQRYADAEGHFREALAQDSESYAPLVNLGGALLTLNKYEEALEVNLRAVRARPEDPLAHSQLGSSYAALGQLDKAEEYLRRAIALEPGHFSLPHLRLARVCERKNNYPEAVRLLEEFLRIHPDAPQSQDIRRLLEARRGPEPGP